MFVDRVIGAALGTEHHFQEVRRGFAAQFIFRKGLPTCCRFCIQSA